MRDHVRYRVPGGALVHALFVKRDLRRTFAYRTEALAQLFSSRNAAAS